jgi:hypothetical protein
MKCARCHELLPAHAGGELSPSEQALCQAHVEACAACAARLDELREAVSLLRQVGRSETVPPWQAELRRRLSQQPPPSPSLSVRLWQVLERLGLDSAPRLGLAAAGLGLLLIAVPLGLRTRGEPAAAVFVPDEQIAASFRVPSQRIAVVQLDFVADDAVADVQFEVTLPSGLAFIDAGRPLLERTLSWRGSLATGSNPIPLAVRGDRPGRYRVVALARGSGIEVRHNILLEVVVS